MSALRESHHGALLAALGKWLLLGGLVGVLAGTASAWFLKALNAATELRVQHGWLLFLLPLGGALISWLYMKAGKNSARGNNLILEQIAGGQEAVPLRMAPLVLLGTLTTHLFGGSAGREGTAVQMGGSLADALGRLLRIGRDDRAILLICGISGGFGSVFGTPLAGTVFALEVLAIGLLRYEALIPALIAALVGNSVAVSVWHAPHSHYHIEAAPELSALLLGKVLLASAVFGLVSLLFSEATHALKALYTRLLPNPLAKAAAGGLIVIALTYLLGTRDYLGLGLPLIERSFDSGAGLLTFLWKLIFTSLTLGAGYQGGEVTPLFAIGATLGSALSQLLHVSGPFLAALGFIGVFCGAANTPLACFIMGIELFGIGGTGGLVYMFVACAVSYLFSGHTGIYTSQRVAVSKSLLAPLPGGLTLASFKQQKAQRRQRP
ncbi:voltage-gated chloride channel family protein [Paenibacillus athensensis]|nr:voltage-gated chloride channel family protein [Paenibacillus athensensis]